MADGLTKYALLKCDMCIDSPLEYTMLEVRMGDAGVYANGKVIATNKSLNPKTHFIEKFKLCKSEKYWAAAAEINKNVTEQLENGKPSEEQKALLEEIQKRCKKAIEAAQMSPNNPPYPCVMIPDIWMDTQTKILTGVDFEIVDQISNKYEEFISVCDEIAYLAIQANYKLTEKLRMVGNLTYIDYIDRNNRALFTHTIRIEKEHDQLCGIRDKLHYEAVTFHDEFLEAIQLHGEKGTIEKELARQVQLLSKCIGLPKSSGRKMNFGSEFDLIYLLQFTGDKDAKKAYEAYKEQCGDQTSEGYSYTDLSEEAYRKLAEKMPDLGAYISLMRMATEYICNSLPEYMFSSAEYEKLFGSYFDEAINKLIQGLEELSQELLKEAEKNEILTTNSWLPCKLGGKITVQDSGQWFIDARNKVRKNLDAFMDKIVAYAENPPDLVPPKGEATYDDLVQQAEASLQNCPDPINRELIEKNWMKGRDKLLNIVVLAIKTMKEMMDNNGQHPTYSCPAYARINLYSQNQLNNEERKKELILSSVGTGLTILGMFSFPPAVSTAIWLAGTGVTEYTTVANAQKNQLGVSDAVANLDAFVGGTGQQFVQDALSIVREGKSEAVSLPGWAGKSISVSNAVLGLQYISDLAMVQYSDFYIGRIEIIIECGSGKYVFSQDYNFEGNESGEMQCEYEINTIFEIQKALKTLKEGAYLDISGLDELYGAERPDFGDGFQTVEE